MALKGITGRGITHFGELPMKASAVQPPRQSARRARADLNLPVAIIFALIGLLLTVYVGGLSYPSDEVELIGP